MDNNRAGSIGSINYIYLIAHPLRPSVGSYTWTKFVPFLLHSCLFHRLALKLRWTKSRLDAEATDYVKVSTCWGIRCGNRGFGQ